MKFFALQKSNILIAGAAAFMTLLTRFFIFTPDCNLLVVAITFICLYTLLFLTVYAVRKIRSFCTKES